MAYNVPAFNLNVNIWRNGNATSNPPDVTCMGSLTLGNRVTETINAFFVRYVLVPRLTDIRGQFQSTGSDTVEIPAGTGRFYTVTDVDDVGKGWTNEHRQGMMAPSGTTPTPLP